MVKRTTQNSMAIRWICNFTYDINEVNVYKTKRICDKKWDILLDNTDSGT